jgi:hypothetical protein
LLRTSLPLIGALLVAALILYLVARWRQRAAAGVTPPAGDQLAHFRSLYERGQMSREEFDRVRALLIGQVRQEINVPGVPAAPRVPPPPAVTPPPEAPPAPQGPPPAEPPTA